ncbi:MAG TPA: DUF420 domain-containing protein [Byssovorax sp.]|jgi:putative membrane protein
MADLAAVTGPDRGLRASDRPFFLFNALVSAAALAFIAWLLLLRRGGSSGGSDLGFMPAVNASLNALAATLLVGGRAAIARKQVRIHKFAMVAAFAASALFFVGYAVYHYAHGDSHYPGVGAIRVVYFTVLVTHIVLSAAVVPLALASLWFATRKRFTTHRKIARVTFPIWLYVSVTGVVIYFMLRP